MTKSIITITTKDNSLSVNLEFEPAAATKGPMTDDQAAAMEAMRAIKEWASARGGNEEDDI
jgi:hypothetical protein